MLERIRVCSTFLAALVIGCDDAFPPVVERASFQPLPALSQPTPRLPDQPSDRISRRLPQFGGLSRQGNDRLVLWLTDTSVAQQARGIAAEELRDQFRSSPDFEVRVARYSFSQLRTWDFAVLPLLKITGVTWSEINESQNRIRIGIESPAVLQRLEPALAQLRLPDDAVQFEVSTKPVPLAALTDRTRPFIAGTQIQSCFSQGDYKDQRKACTHGPNVVWSGHAGRYMVTNSHCTQMTPPFGGWIHASIYQNIAPKYQSDSAYYIMGREIADPAGFTGYPCPSGATCRYSDAALVEITAGNNDQGYIAQPSGSAAVYPSLSGSLTTNSSNSRFRIDGVLGSLYSQDTVNKVGSFTGWTAGAVITTCRNLYVQDTTNIYADYYLLCSGVVQLGSGHRDSGSPVFFQTSSGQYLMAGMLWGAAPPQAGEISSETYFSHWRYISTELGGTSSALDPTPLLQPSAYITGPTWLTDEGWYTWTANPSGGDGNYSYKWERSNDGGETWQDLGVRTKDLSVYVFGDAASWYWRVQVTSAGLTGTSDPLLIRYYPPSKDQNCDPKAIDCTM